MPSTMMTPAAVDAEYDAMAKAESGDETEDLINALKERIAATEAIVDLELDRRLLAALQARKR
jgi:hypothetical protein